MRRDLDDAALFECVANLGFQIENHVGVDKSPSVLGRTIRRWYGPGGLGARLRRLILSLRRPASICRDQSGIQPTPGRSLDVCVRVTGEHIHDPLLGTAEVDVGHQPVINTSETVRPFGWAARK